MTPPDKIGRIALCMNGRLGRIEKQVAGAWVGVGILDGKPWQSWQPAFLSKDEGDQLIYHLENDGITF